MKRLNSLRSLQVVYGLAFIALIAITGVVGVVGMGLSERGAAEARRIGTLIQTVQQARGDLYRQTKEVFDFYFLADPEAAGQYRDYGAQLETHFRALEDLAASPEESAAVARLVAAYGAVRTDTDAIMARQSGATDAASELELFDARLEGERLAAVEVTFDAAENLFLVAQGALEARIRAWVRLAVAMLLIPIALAALLLLLARGFLQRAFVKPLSAVLDAMAAYGAGRLDHRAPEGGADEMVSLQRAINKLSDDLAHSREALVRSEKQAALGALVPMVAHNIRNPLASIRATAQVNLVPSLPGDLRDALTGIVGTVDRLENWLGSLLSYLNPLKANKADGSLSDCADNALALLEPKLSEKRIAVEREGEVEVAWGEDTAPLDAHLIEQALYGLLNNAIEASPEDGKLRLCVGRTDGECWLRIDDQGPGLPFEPTATGLFPGPTTKTSGSGLGIPFAYKVCDLHDGRLAFETAPDGGARATLTLPAAGAASIAA
jgi:signal transduction histidine kinase